MKKNDIIAVYAEKNNVTKKVATEVVGSVIDIIKDGILTEGVVDITGFVKFTKVHREARTGKPSYRWSYCYISKVCTKGRIQESI